MFRARRKRDFPGMRGGFTLVELLTVIAVIGTLIAILLPAVQAAWEVARRMSCANNLRQVGLGLHGYHDALRTFPPGCIEREKSCKNARQLSWSALLLPYIEQKGVTEMLDLGKGYNSEANASAAAILIPTYLCPSNPHEEKHIRGLAVCDYGGIYGASLIDGRQYAHYPNGTMLYDEAVDISQISDGTSTTLIVAEDSLGRDMQWINGENIMEQNYPINAMPAGVSAVQENEIRSAHIGGGANGLFCDGSVRFIYQDIAPEPLTAICTRAEGDIAGEY